MISILIPILDSIFQRAFSSYIVKCRFEINEFDMYIYLVFFSTIFDAMNMYQLLLFILLFEGVCNLEE